MKRMKLKFGILTSKAQNWEDESYNAFCVYVSLKYCHVYGGTHDENNGL
jgi:hypothetical protein